MQDKRNIVAIFADQDVGLKATRYVLERYTDQVKCVVTTEDNEISGMARSFACKVLNYPEISAGNAGRIFEGVEIIFLAWWPRIIPGYIIKAPAVGVVNFHPSLLPYNRGKNYNFWTIVEDTPFGVTLHFVDEGIDSGDILFQKRIRKTWLDTGETLYSRAKKEMVKLFRARYLDIIEGRFTRTKQDFSLGNLHFARELDPASRVDLDKCYSARDLLNLLRARTFKGNPSCYFFEDGKKYEVRISIKEAEDGTG